MLYYEVERNARCRWFDQIESAEAEAKAKRKRNTWIETGKRMEVGNVAKHLIKMNIHAVIGT